MLLLQAMQHVTRVYVFIRTDLDDFIDLKNFRMYLQGCTDESAVKICQPLSDQIVCHAPKYISSILDEQLSIKRQEKSRKKTCMSAEVATLKESLSVEMLRNISLASEKGDSMWLTCLLIEEFGFSLHWRAFLDTLALRHGWSLLNTPLSCVCGNSFSVGHALSCPLMFKGWFSIY